MPAQDDLERLAQQYGISAWQEDVPDLARRNPEDYAQVMRDYEAQYQRRAVPTFSAGGVGGDADLNHDRIADAGWSQGAGGQWSRGASSRPGSLASLLMPGSGGGLGAPMGGGANPLMEALLQSAFAPQPQPVSTKMPVGGPPQLSALLRY